MGWFRRYRHGRGFGIHSPFAYRFILEVLEEKLPYYDYDLIQDHSQRIIYRIAAFFQPQCVRALGGADIEAAMMACPKARRWIAGEWQMAVCTHCDDVDTLMQEQSDHCVIVLHGSDRELLDSIKKWLDEAAYGMTFDNERNMAVVVVNRKLPRQDFTARF